MAKKGFYMNGGGAQAQRDFSEFVSTSQRSSWLALTV